MKRLVLTGIATFAFALGAFAQGAFSLDNSQGVYGFTVNQPGQANWYSGTLGVEVWELNAAAVPAGINITPAAGSGQTAYAALKTAGFKLEATLPGLTTVAPASISVAQVNMPDVSPAGSTVVVGLAAWNTAATSWANMLATQDANTRAGVLAFLQPTANYNAQPAPTPSPLNMDSAGTDLVMTALTSIPEPGTFALAGLGAAALLIFRRRK